MCVPLDLVPTLVGFGEDEMWNDFRELGNDGFDALDDVFQEPPTSQQVLHHMPTRTPLSTA